MLKVGISMSIADLQLMNSKDNVTLKKAILKCSVKTKRKNKQQQQQSTAAGTQKIQNYDPICIWGFWTSDMELSQTATCDAEMAKCHHANNPLTNWGNSRLSREVIRD